MSRFDTMVAVVTGGSSGIGLATAELLAQEGAKVALLDVAQGASDHYWVRCDVSDRSSVEDAIADVVEKFGGLDIVVNNAGTTVTKAALQQTEDDYDQVLDTNLKGTWLVATEAARRMVAAGQGGSIVNVASILGERVAGGVAPYAMSKAGVIQATKALALELARHKIRVNALLPGYVVTDLNRDFLASEAGEKLRARIPSRRFNELEDLDGPLLLLASAAGAGMSGASLAVDGAHRVSSL